MTATSRSTAPHRHPASPERHRPLSRLLARGRLAALAGDRSGATAIIVGLLSMVLLAFAALGTEVGYWYYVHRDLQNAADSAALSAVAALQNLATPDSQHITQATSEAKAAAAQYGFVDAQGGVAVTVNIPPTSGGYTGVANAVEVFVTEPQALFLTAAIQFGNNPLFATNPTQKVRAVATPATNGNGCVVTLDRGSVVDLFQNGNTQLNIPTCDLYINSSASDALDQVGKATITAEAAYIYGGISDSGQAALTTTKGTYTGSAPIPDPYAGVPPPYTSPGSSCTNASPPNASHVNVSTSGGTTNFTPDGSNMAVFCGGWDPSAGNTSTIHLDPGLYVVDGGSFGCNNCTISGDNVTIFLTGSGTNYAGMSFSGNGVTQLNINAPTDAYVSSHPSFKGIEGIAIYGDRNAPCPNGACTISSIFSGNATATINGVIYLPAQNVTFNGNGATTPDCSQIVSFTLTLHGNSSFVNNCSAYQNQQLGSGVVNIGNIPAHLVE